ncbi:hypothetical protein GLAREA_06345 [Glarea lozoyensis ATCC 20868]|uniref:Uncharacterized protein n=1 Tax=Glarea lozoyensis (strain ATCC 20868 / MF5171) TaxID=1116229 RepID=S3E4L0_GLAL2|nr:uncharacterized protein GLAREA_06345 [Glarea lozoyensis ATCC 20868]EPE33333.1 hypothetical protein GLAREA_06345 [Glarea lozoyensis ATCC 20868]
MPGKHANKHSKEKTKSVKSNDNTIVTAKAPDPPPQPWSDWIWSEYPPCYFRARKNLKGEWEYDHYIPDLPKEDSSKATPRSTPTLAYSSLVKGNDSLQRLYKEKESYEVGAYTWSPEPICLDLEVMSLKIGYEDPSASPTQPQEPTSEAKKVAFDGHADEIISEKENSKSRKKERGKKINGDRKKHHISRWRDEVEKERREER